MTKENFEKIKAEIVKRSIEKSICTTAKEKMLAINNHEEFIVMLKENFSWCYNNKVVDFNIMEQIGEAEMAAVEIYYKGIIPELEGRTGIILCCDVNVKMLNSSQVGEMLGSSQVGEMLGSSQVGEMLGSSQVGKMWDSSQVGKMLNSSQVGEMWDSSQVGKMLNSSQVGKMWGSSQVGKMLNSSQVGKMWGSSQVGEMWGSSQVGEMLNSSQVGEMWGSSQVGEMLGSSTVRNFSSQKKIIKFEGKTYCFIDFNTKEIFCGDSFVINPKK